VRPVLSLISYCLRQLLANAAIAASRLSAYLPRIVGDIGVISDEMRAMVQSEWSELAHKLPPKKPQG